MISAYVPSLELCKKLRDLGWKKDTMFWWVNNQLFFGEEHIAFGLAKDREGRIPAPTVGELGLVLPDNLDEVVRENISEINDELYFKWCNVDHPFYNADLLAETLIWMIENNLVKLEEKE